MIERQALGKEYRFSVRVGAECAGGLASLVRGCLADKPPLPDWPLLCNWPAIATLHGTAGMLHVWEDLGVDPLQARMIREEFRHVRDPLPDEELAGRLTVEDLTEHTNPTTGLDQQIALRATFSDHSGREVARYACIYALPLAVWLKT